MQTLAPSPPLGGTPAPTRSSSRRLTEAEFAEVFAAADFAYEHGLYLNTSVTISWTLLGAESAGQVQHLTRAFLKCANDWLRQRALPVFWIYSHECGPTVGLHTHFLFFIPLPLEAPKPKTPETPKPKTLRDQFRVWAMQWPQRRLNCSAPHAIRVRGPRREIPWLHWTLVNYLCKGYDPEVIICSGRDTVDGRDIRLGDVILAPFKDPGSVELNNRIGVSRSLGPQQRRMGVPGGLEYQPRRRFLDPFRLQFAYKTVPGPRRTPFKSRYENGGRDIWDLYPREYLDAVMPWAIAPAVAPPAPEMPEDVKHVFSCDWAAT